MLFSRPVTLANGTRLGPYEILGPLGAGGMGEVYRARDPRLGREVAVKVLPHAVAGDPERQQRFEAEARAAGAINHPNIVTLHDVGLSSGAPYLVTEILEGESPFNSLQFDRSAERYACCYISSESHLYHAQGLR
jgi:serine/threonine protein kinase